MPGLCLDVSTNQVEGVVVGGRTNSGGVVALSNLPGWEAEVRDQTGGGTVYYVAATGPPYPVEIKRQGPDSVQIVLDRFNEPVSLAPPPNAVDASRLG